MDENREFSKEREKAQSRGDFQKLRQKKQMEEDRKMRLTMKKWFERNTTDDNLNDKTDIQRQNPKKEAFGVVLKTSVHTQMTNDSILGLVIAYTRLCMFLH